MSDVPNSLKGKKPAPRFDFSWMSSIASRIRSALGQCTAEEAEAIERQSETAFRESIRRISQPARHLADLSDERIEHGDQDAELEDHNVQHGDDVEHADHIVQHRDGDVQHGNDDFKLRSDDVQHRKDDFNSGSGDAKYEDDTISNEQTENEEELSSYATHKPETDYEEDEDELNALYEAEIDADDVDADDFDADVLAEYDDNECDGLDEDKDEDEFVNDTMEYEDQAQKSHNGLDDDENNDDNEEIDDDMDVEDDIMDNGSPALPLDTEEPQVYSEYTSEHGTEDFDQEEADSDNSLPPVELSDHPFEEFSSESVEEDGGDIIDDSTYTRNGADGHIPDAPSDAETQDEAAFQNDAAFQNVSSTQNASAFQNGASIQNDAARNALETVTNVQTHAPSHLSATPESSSSRDSRTPKYVGFLFGPGQEMETKNENTLLPRNSENVSENVSQSFSQLLDGTDIIESEKLKEKPDQTHEPAVSVVKSVSMNEVPASSIDSVVPSFSRPTSSSSRWNLFNIGFSVSPSDSSFSTSIEPSLSSGPSVIASHDTLHYSHTPVFSRVHSHLEHDADEEFSLLSQTAHRLLAGSSLFGGVSLPTISTADTMPPPPPKEDPEESLRKTAGVAQSLFAHSSLFGGKRKRDEDESYDTQNGQNGPSVTKIQKSEEPIPHPTPIIPVESTSPPSGGSPAGDKQMPDYTSPDNSKELEEGKDLEESPVPASDSPQSRSTTRTRASRTIPTRQRPMTRSARRALEAERKAAEEQAATDAAAAAAAPGEDEKEADAEIEKEKEVGKKATKPVRKRSLRKRRTI